MKKLFLLVSILILGKNLHSMDLLQPNSIFGISVPLYTELIICDPVEKYVLFLPKKGREDFQSYLVGGNKPQYMNGLEVVNIKHINSYLLKVVVKKSPKKSNWGWMFTVALAVVVTAVLYRSWL